MMEISFVIPCYNEEGNLSLLHKEIHRVFDPEGISFELVLVNDGSKDGTKEEIRSLVASSKPHEIKAIHFSRNFGKEAAIFAGLSNAAGNFVCVIDADLQQPPKVAKKMYDMLVSDPSLDMVAAYQKNRSESGLLRFFKKSFYKLINGLSETKFRPDASDFRMFRRPVAEAVLSMKEFYRFSKGIFSYVGFETAFIPYVARERNAGVSKWSFTKLFAYAIEGIVGYSTKPLRFATFTGCAFSLASFMMLLVLLILGICQVEVSPVLILTGVILLVGGIQMIFIGIIGEYLLRTYMQGKDRPVYIIKERWEKGSNGFDWK